MKISNIGFNSYLSAPAQKTYFAAPIRDTFELSFEGGRKRLPFSGEEYLKDYKKMSAQESEKRYGQIVQSTNMQDRKTFQAAVKSLKMAVIIKRQLDEQYGENNYTFVSIGTSPFGIARGLEYMGADIKYIPISGIAGYTEENKESIFKAFKNGENTKYYKNFLNSIGLNDKQIEKSEKSYVLFGDFASTGNSLKNMEYFIRNEANIKSGKVKFINLTKYLKNIACFHPNLTDEIQSYMKEYFYDSKIEQYSDVPHMNYDKMQNINTEIQKSQSGYYKSSMKDDFNFLILYLLDSIGLLKNA